MYHFSHNMWTPQLCKIHALWERTCTCLVMMPTCKREDANVGKISSHVPGSTPNELEVAKYFRQQNSFSFSFLLCVHERAWNKICISGSLALLKKNFRANHYTVTAKKFMTMRNFLEIKLAARTLEVVVFSYNITNTSIPIEVNKSEIKSHAHPPYLKEQSST